MLWPDGCRHRIDLKGFRQINIKESITKDHQHKTIPYSETYCFYKIQVIENIDFQSYKYWAYKISDKRFMFATAD